MELARVMNTLLQLLITLFIAFCNADYTLEIRAVKYQNKDKRDANGDCCDYSVFSCNECDVDFHFCVRAYGTSALATSCWYSAETSDDKSNAGSITFPTTGELYSGAGLSNPITFNKGGSWPGSFQLMVRITDSDSGTADDLVDRITFDRNMSPSSSWSGTITGNSYYSRATFTARFRVQCNSNYYTSSCSVYCKARDDDNGHYDCNSSGQRVCKTGWTDPASYCLTPICTSGCSETGGYCNVPSECICNDGWTGSLCNECIPKDGCSTDHGHCEGPYTCVCESGYGGTYCTQDADVCGHQAPCKYGATCTNTGLDSYSCNCSPGYTGTNCDVNINECGPEPCQNGGECTDLINGYECDCVPGYTGANCDTNIDDCASNPCQNGGNCTDLVNGFKCDCAPGYNGIHCEGHQCDMETDPCENGGMCIKTDSGNGYQCDCVPGYMGTDCESDINECNNTELCYNNGTCNNIPGSYNCTCAPGFTGFNCTIDINDCLTNNCSLNSVCVDLIDSYSCDCDVGFTGELCDIQIDYCTSSPCLNNGTCNSYIGFYGCNCPDGFTGSECETNIDDCSQNPCQNGGICIDEINAFICNCSTGFTGTVCNTTVDYCDPHPCETYEECIVDTVASDNFLCVVCIENVCDGQGSYIGDTPTSNETSSTNSSLIDTPTSNAVSEDRDPLMIGMIVGVSAGGALLLCCLCISVVCCIYCRGKKKRDEDVYMASTYNGEVRHNPLFMSPRELITSNSLTRSFKKSSLTRSKERRSSSRNPPNTDNDDSSIPGYDTIKPRSSGSGWYSKLLNPLNRSPNVRSRSTSPRPMSPSSQGYAMLQSQDSSCELMKDPSDDTQVSGHYSKLHDSKPTVTPFNIADGQKIIENPYVYHPPLMSSSQSSNLPGHDEEAESDLKQDKHDDAILSDLPPPIDGTVIYETIGTPEPPPTQPAHYDSLPTNINNDNTSVFNPYEYIS